MTSGIQAEPLKVLIVGAGKTILKKSSCLGGAVYTD